MNMKLMSASVATGLMLLAGAAQADVVTVNGGTVHFEGKLINAACSVSTKSANQTVQLGQYRTAMFTKVGDTSALIPFTIVLNDCDPSVAQTAAVSFSGQADAVNNSLLAIASSENTSTAKGVGIEILDEASNPLKPDGGVTSVAHTLFEGTNTLNFSARYKATAATTSPGQANADATFIMKYE